MKRFIIIFFTGALCLLSFKTLHAQYIQKSDRRQSEIGNYKPEKTSKRKKEPTQRQKSPKTGKSFGEKITFGGNIGGGFGDPAFADLSPTIGYRVSEKLELGLGPSYSYFRFKNDNFRGDDHLYGGRIYSQFRVYKTLSLRGEVESMRVGLADSTLNDGSNAKEWQIAPLAGASVQFKFLGRVNFQFTLLYNPLHEDGRSWRATPWVTRFGFGL